MNKDKKILYTVSALILFITLILLFLPIGAMRRWITAILVPFFAAATAFFIRKRSILSYNKRQVLLLMAVIGVMAVIVFYMSGLSFGFTRTYSPFSPDNLFKNIIPIASIIVFTEIIRSILLASEDKYVVVFAYLFASVTEILALGEFANLKSFNMIMDLIGLAVLPAFISNLVYNYLSRRYGIYPNIVYRLIVSLYSYVFYYIPAAPDALLAFIRLIMPLAIYMFIDSLYEKKRRYAIKKKSKFAIPGAILGLLLMTSLIMLISCKFQYGAVVVATESMTGEINRGDAIIYEEYDDEIINEGDVLVFNKGNIKVVHRVIKIENVNNEVRYYTKGDANESPDAGYITKSNIIGKVELKVSYVGYPTVWLRNIFSGRMRGDIDV